MHEDTRSVIDMPTASAAAFARSSVNESMLNGSPSQDRRSLARVEVEFGESVFRFVADDRRRRENVPERFVVGEVINGR